MAGAGAGRASGYAGRAPDPATTTIRLFPRTGVGRRNPDTLGRSPPPFTVSPNDPTTPAAFAPPPGRRSPSADHGRGAPAARSGVPTLLPNPLPAKRWTAAMRPRRPARSDRSPRLRPQPSHNRPVRRVVAPRWRCGSTRPIRPGSPLTLRPRCREVTGARTPPSGDRRTSASPQRRTPWTFNSAPVVTERLAHAGILR